MSKPFNPFDQFRAGVEKKAHIKAFDYEITYRELSMREADAFNKRLLKGYKGKGDPDIDIAEATKIAYEKIAMCLIDPALTVSELGDMGVSATPAINEIAKLLEGKQEEMLEEADEKGNENSEDSNPPKKPTT